MIKIAVRTTIVGLALAAAVAAPSLTHAASTKPFSSKVCPYSMKVPSNYTIVAGKKTGDSDSFKGPAVQEVQISCPKMASAQKMTDVVSKVAANIQSHGYHIDKKAAKGAAGRIDYSKGSARFMILLQTYKGLLFNMVFGDTKAAWNKDLSTFKAMSDSVKPH